MFRGPWWFRVEILFISLLKKFHPIIWKKLDEAENILTCDFCTKLFHGKCCDIPNAKLKSLISVREMVTWFSPTYSKLKPLEKLNILLQTQGQFEKRLTDLGNEVARMKTEKSNQTISVIEIAAELEMRNSKKTNLVFTGLHGKITNTEQIQGNISDNLEIPADEMLIEKVTAIHPKNNPTQSLMIFSFANEALRNKILKNAKKIRKSANPDLNHVYWSHPYVPTKKRTENSA